jgi:hypothetical protein
MTEEVIYHYCGLDSFEKIVNSQTIWLTNALKTNDRYEIKWITELLKSFPDIKSHIKVNKFKTLYEYYVKSFIRPHIACFSKEGDILSQWRGYANNGKGVSIGFDRKYFEAIAKRDQDQKEISIKKVVYLENDQKQELKRLIDARDFKGFAEVNEDFNVGDIVLASELVQLGVKFKHYTFEEEKEVRVIQIFDKLALETDAFKYLTPETNPFKYKGTDDDLTSYVELPLKPLDPPETTPPSIKEIIIGPKCKADEADVNDFVKSQFGYTIKVKRSKSSYGR